MSNRQLAKTGVTFEPVLEGKPQPPSGWPFALGVVYPALVIGIELATHLCAQTLFDPMPTIWHAIAIVFVPASNLLIWKKLEAGWRWNVRWLAFANGAAIAIAAVYALLFLPLAPLAVVGILVGVGLLPLAPLAAFASALKLRAELARAHGNVRLGRPLLGGLVAGLALLVACDLPSAATRIGIRMAASDEPTQRERGLTLLRTLGDDDLLLRLCYDASGQPTGLLSQVVMLTNNNWVGRRRSDVSTAEAREIYYRLHGVPFNAKPAPVVNASRLGEVVFDSDHGGTQVGGRLPGLHLASSVLDGSISGDDLVAYLEWTIEFRNAGSIDREARLEIALPPGGVVSRATLWVNGEEREAAYGGRGEVRAAYQRVAVVQRRDPLLVTTRGADRVLVQAFPVPRNGGTIKFKVGITAPLEIADPATARLALPAIVDRNFSFAPEASHAVWIESKQALATSAAGLTSSRVEIRRFRVAGTIDDGALSGARQVLTVERHADMNRAVARIGEEVPVVQEIAPAASVETAMMLVIDGSARLAGRTAGLIEALDAIPPGTRVGAIIAAEPTRTVAPAPWSEAQKRAVAELLRSA